MVYSNTVLFIVIITNCICQFINVHNFLIKYNIYKLLTSSAQYKNMNYNFDQVYNCNYLNDSDFNMKCLHNPRTHLFNAYNNYYLLLNIF